MDTSKITDKLAEDILTTAIEGGIGYWAAAQNLKRHPENTGPHDRRLNVYYVELRDAELNNRSPWHPVTLDTIRLGVARIVGRELKNGQIKGGYNLKACVDLLAGDPHDELDYDAATADIIVQAGIFNEIIFG